MGRPRKAGLKTFPMETNSGKIMDDIIMELGADAFALYVRILQVIYGNNGYYCYQKPVYLIAFTQLLLSKTRVNTIINRLFDGFFFSREKFENYGIFTSETIQKNYVRVGYRKREKTLVKEYLLIDAPSDFFIQNLEFLPSETGVNDSNNEGYCHQKGGLLPSKTPYIYNIYNIYKNNSNKSKKKNRKDDNTVSVGIAQTVVDYWNDWTKKHQEEENRKPVNLTKKKTALINERIKEGFEIEKILEAAEKQELLMQATWFNLSWLIKDDDNWRKVIEMNYKGYGKSKRKTEKKQLKTVKEGKW